MLDIQTVIALLNDGIPEDDFHTTRVHKHLGGFHTIDDGIFLDG